MPPCSRASASSGQPALWGEGKEQVDEVWLEAKVSVLGG